MEKVDTSNDLMLQQAIEHFWETFPPFWRRIRKHVREIAAEEYDISFEQFHILRHIHQGLASVSELADNRGISRAAISQSVDALVEKGLIARRTDEQDRRYIHLELTPSGNRLLNAIFEKNREWMKKKLQQLSPDELSQINQALDVLRTTFNSSTDE